MARAALRVEGARGAGPDPVRHARGRVREDQHRRLHRSPTTLNYKMQRIAEKWVYAAAIIPNLKNPDKVLKDRGIPRREWSWIKGLRGHNIHNAAGGVIDYRTGEVLAYAGSASYTAKGSKKLQPQFDVLGDGWRQPGSSIKPLVYLVGIEDRTMTAATMFMDVVTNFASVRRQGLVPDPGRRPRARPRPAAQRAPVLAQHPGDQGRPRSTASTTSSSG